MTFKDDVGDEVLKALEQASVPLGRFQCQDRCCDRPSSAEVLQLLEPMRTR